MAIKLGKVVVYHEELPLINLLDPSKTWFCKVTWHVKYFISPLALEQWLSDMARWWITMTGFHPSYLHLQKTNEHQTRQDTERLPFLKSHDPLIKWQTWGHVKISKIYIFTILRVMVSKPGRELTMPVGSARKRLSRHWLLVIITVFSEIFQTFSKSNSCDYSDSGFVPPFDDWNLQKVQRNNNFFCYSSYLKSLTYLKHLTVLTRTIAKWNACSLDD